MIQAQHLTKRYGACCALSDVSFSVEKGEIVGLLGPNGAGKSTAMNILTGCLAATEGTVSVDGFDIREDPLEVKRRVGYLPELPPVYPDMTVDEYLSFVYDLKGVTFPRKPHLDEICDTVGIRDVRHRLIGHLSKGYRQRVGIAQALVGDPPVIVLDEPTVGLDPKQIMEVRALIRKLAGAHTVLLSTHILPEVQAVCGRVLIIHRGKLIADEPIDGLARLVEDSVRYRYSVIGEPAAVRQALSSVPGVKKVVPADERDGDGWVYEIVAAPGADIRRGAFLACAKASLPILTSAKVGGDLESVFLRLVK